MSTNHAQFRQKIKGFEALVYKNYGKNLRKVTLVGYGAAIQNTNVDTGTARLCWRVSSGEVDTSISTKPDAKPRKGSGPTGTETAVSGIDVVSMKIKMGDYSNVYISNNLMYIGFLNRRYDYLDNILDEMDRASAKLNGD